MPAAKKVSWAQLRVGVMALAAMVIVGVLIFLLTGGGNIFSSSATLRTYLPDSSGMGQGAPVRLNGILIGSIERVNLSGRPEPKQAVEIEMTIEERFLPNIPEDSLAAISASNLLGDKFINITRGNSQQHIRDGGVLAALDTQDIPELMAKSSDILTVLQMTLKRMSDLLGEIEAGHGNVGKLLKDEELYTRLNSTVAEAQKLIVAVRTGQGTLGKLLNDDTLYQEIRQPISRLNRLLEGLEAGQGTAGKLLKDGAIYDEARTTLAEMRSLVNDLNSGKGTAGKLLKDEALYARMNEVVLKLDHTIDQLNTGQGTLGQLIVNPQLYESINGVTSEMRALLKDIRAEPKKFLRIKLGLF
ncbi:MAG: MlaD family protein [Bryobacteraceae bacterium]